METYGRLMKFIFERQRSNEKKNCEKDIGVANDG